MHETPNAPEATSTTDPLNPEEAPSTEFAQALEQHEGAAKPEAAAGQEARAGQKVRARCVSVGDTHVLFDFGGRSEGAAELRHFRKDDGTITIGVGDERDLLVVEAGDQVVLAPALKKPREKSSALPQIKAAQAAGLPVTGKVTGVNTGGLTVDVSGMRAFCPVSQIENGFVSDTSAYVGRTLEFLVTQIEEGRKNIVLSRRKLLAAADAESSKARIAALAVGDVLEGKVARLEAFGAFVDLGGVDGLVHVSEVSWARVGHPKEVLREGETVTVKVLKIDEGKDGKSRVGLSIKAVAPDPWAGIATRFAVGQRVEGVVSRLADFGAFVQLAPGIDGLVHVSEAALHRVQHVKDVLAPGDKIEVLVLEVDEAKKRIRLSVKQTMEGYVAPAIVERAPRAERGPRAGGAERGARPGGGADRGPRPGGDRGPRGAGGDRGARGAGGDRGPRGGGERGDRGDRGGRREGRVESFGATSAGGNEPTTMALALRKAMEEAKRREQTP